MIHISDPALGKIVKASDGKHYQKFTPFYNECLKHKPDKPLKPLEDGEMNFVKLDDAKMTIDFNETKKDRGLKPLISETV